MPRTSAKANKWLWDNFDHNGSKYLNDKTHKAAWCKACVPRKKEELFRRDLQAVQEKSRESVRSEDELLKAGMHDTGIHSTV